MAETQKLTLAILEAKFAEMKAAQLASEQLHLSRLSALETALAKLAAEVRTIRH